LTGCAIAGTWIPSSAATAAQSLNIMAGAAPVVVQLTQPFT
jgi:hypothetical protein